ncbi:hypothetical protein ACJMK2_037945 [Sinanodonta woodiana]|uniref:Uncharacterized protein n=1 Tax=Sinanodonta woodiana TaxID=1069815 RepID=A0ABD3WQG3_SINWO
MRADMLKDLRTRYEEVETNKLCTLATVLDPTYKWLVFNAHGHDAVKLMLMDEHFQLIESYPESEKFHAPNPELEIALHLSITNFTFYKVKPG